MKFARVLTITTAAFVTHGLGIPVATAFSANENQVPNVSQVSTVISCVMGGAIGLTSMDNCENAIKLDFPSIYMISSPQQ